MASKKTVTNTVVQGSMKMYTEYILGLDCATNTGAAIGRRGVITDVSSINCSGPKGEGIGPRLIRFTKSLMELLNTAPIQLIVVEEPHLRGRGSFLTVGFYDCVMMVASQRGIPVISVHTSTLKLFGAGHGRAEKEDMIRNAKKFYSHLKNDDEADAVLLAMYGFSRLDSNGKCIF